MNTKLSWYEVFVAAGVGVMRQIENLKQGNSDAHGYSGDGWSLHIQGALAELAYSKIADRYWLPVTGRDFRSLAGDVGDVQVRSTTRAGGCLLIHDRDPDDALFVLMIGPLREGTGLAFRYAGALRGAECKRREWWRENTGRPAYFVPQNALRVEPERRAA